MNNRFRKMKHPDSECQRKQEEFLKNCPPEDREFHARLFRYGNAVYRYHQLANAPSNKDSLKLYYEEWLQGLPDNIRIDMEKKGFEKCKSIVPFTRYVNERNDMGLDEWLKKHLSEDDYIAYKDMFEITHK